MKVGIDIDNADIFVSLECENLTPIEHMTPIGARLLAAQLLSAADNIDEYNRVDKTN